LTGEKENRAAVAAFFSGKSPPIIVDPDLLEPGISAPNLSKPDNYRRRQYRVPDIFPLLSDHFGEGEEDRDDYQHRGDHPKIFSARALDKILK